ncbi:MAG: dTDP-glucose 4,6-dehydratase [Deltaproteobacteria bacterium]|jgi:dTDP-glucose 4,6-dehydratase|nr:dTDP-glucose 4,6-dehydratase [Deltaproteobacteria bacterium]
MGDRLVVVTGGAGFIGSNFVRHLLTERPDWDVVNVDALTYAANLANLRDVDQSPRYRFVRGDIADAEFVDGFFGGLGATPNHVVNFAAESHVDRSILGPEEFVRTNVTGTFRLLEAARRLAGCRHVQISTDEVYCSLGDEGAFVEDMPLTGNSPYSASKAAADLLVGAYHHTFGLDTVITRCSNNYGPYQFPEKLIPLMVLNSRQGKELPVYGEGKNVRDWIHVEDHCRGILAAMEQGRSGEAYNFGGASERANIDIVHHIADRVAGNRDLVRFVKDRPGHDWRYAMDFGKARAELGFEPRVRFEEGLDATIDWYLENEEWWQPILSGDYTEFYEKWYGDRA